MIDLLLLVWLMFLTYKFVWLVRKSNKVIDALEYEIRELRWQMAEEKRYVGYVPERSPELPLARFDSEGGFREV